jgi:hypothetical protein
LTLSLPYLFSYEIKNQMDDSTSLQALPGKPDVLQGKLVNGYAYSIIKVKNPLPAGWLPVRTPSCRARYGGSGLYL